MKKIIGFALLSMLSTASFAKTCVISSAADRGSDFNNTIATYTNVENSEKTITTIIKKSGEVMKAVNIDNYYEGVTSKEEIEARTAELIGSQIVMISSDKAGNRLSLVIGVGVDGGDELLKANAMSISDLSSSETAVFDMNEGLTVYCSE